MNKLYIVSIILIFCSSIIAQDEMVPFPEFVGITPNWTYISKDTNHVPNPPFNDTNIYDNRMSQDLLTLDDNLIILESTFSPNPFTGPDGGLVHSLNLENGQVNWIYHSNYYSGNIRREDFFYGVLFLNQNNDISLYSYQGLDTINTSFPRFNFHSRIINYTWTKDGFLIEKKISTDSIPHDSNLAGFGYSIIRRFKQQLLTLNSNPIIQKDTLYNALNFHQVNTECQIDTLSKIEHLYNTEIPTQIKELAIPSQYSKFNDSLLLCLFQSRNLEEPYASPLEAKLQWLNVNNISQGELLLEHEIDVTDLIPNVSLETNSQIIPAFLSVLDSTVILYNRVKDHDDPILPESYTWLKWLNSKGELLANIDLFVENEKEYDLIHPLFVRDDKLFFAMDYITDNESGIDIYCLEQGSNDLQIVSSLIYSNKSDDLSYLNIRLSKVIDNNQIIISAPVLQVNDEHRTLFNFYHSFNMDDLDLISNTSDLNIELLKNDFTVFPNPVIGDDLSVQFESIPKGKMEIYNLNGQLVKRHMSSKKSENISVTGLADGLYMLRYLSKESNYPIAKMFSLKRH